MIIYLVGYMASGKSIFGRQLADRLHFRFLDLDEMIEIATGYTISGYFTRFGETAFRSRERELLESHLHEIDTVIATGGGTPCFGNNMAWMNTHGITVFIDAGLETILGRLEGKVQHRAMLNKIPPDQLPEFVAAHMASRRPFYEMAKVRIDGDDPDLEALVNTLSEFS